MSAIKKSVSEEPVRYDLQKTSKLKLVFLNSLRPGLSREATSVKLINVLSSKSQTQASSSQRETEKGREGRTGSYSV